MRLIPDRWTAAAPPGVTPMLPQLATPMPTRHSDRLEAEDYFSRFWPVLRDLLLTVTAFVAHLSPTILQNRRTVTDASAHTVSVHTGCPVTVAGRLPLVRIWFESERCWRVEWDHSEWDSAVFRNPASALAFAKGACGGCPATIVLWIGSIYAVVQQEQGWPKPIC